MIRFTTTAFLLMTMAGVCFGAVSAPEIDASTGIAGLTLLTGGLLVLRARRKRT